MENNNICLKELTRNLGAAVRAVSTVGAASYERLHPTISEMVRREILHPIIKRFAEVKMNRRYGRRLRLA